MPALPILYSFRRCPYAMRARLAVAVSGQTCELREVMLRDKPHELLDASAKGTVPVLVDAAAGVVAESIDIMLWALRRHDPEQWLEPQAGDLPAMLQLVERCDGDFKQHLDRYKYPDRHGAARDEHRAAGALFLDELNQQIGHHDFLFGNRVALADMAIAPFVRQFAGADDSWFASQPWQSLQRWLRRFIDSPLYARVMVKYPQWRAGAPVTLFP